MKRTALSIGVLAIFALGLGLTASPASGGGQVCPNFPSSEPTLDVTPTSGAVGDTVQVTGCCPNADEYAVWLIQTPFGPYETEAKHGSGAAAPLHFGFSWDISATVTNDSDPNDTIPTPPGAYNFWVYCYVGGEDIPWVTVPFTVTESLGAGDPTTTTTTTTTTDPSAAAAPSSDATTAPTPSVEAEPAFTG